MYLSMTALTVLGDVIGVRLTEGPCEEDDCEMHEGMGLGESITKGLPMPRSVPLRLSLRAPKSRDSAVHSRSSTWIDQAQSLF